MSNVYKDRYLRQRIFWALFSICVIWVLLGLWGSILFFANYYENQIALHLKQSSHYIATGLKQHGINYLLHINAAYRVSLIDSFGNVLYDNAITPDTLDNHATRIEFQESMKYGVAQSYRYSQSTQQEMLYYATKIMLSPTMLHTQYKTTKQLATTKLSLAPNNASLQPYILRIASVHKNILSLIYDAMPYICIGVLICLIMSIMLARSIASFIIAPLNALHLDNPLALKHYKELYPLLHKIDEQNTLIHAQIKELKTKQEEFSAITQNMKDGFLLLDSKGDILSFNKSAMQLFGTLHEGMNIAMLHEQYTRWFMIALEKQKYRQKIEHEGRNYQVIIESVFEQTEQTHHTLHNIDSQTLATYNKQPIGVAMIILDITEKTQREQLRREFSANVSHELKTPLTSILGIIEMLQNNLIKHADIPKFIGNIHKEAKHLMTLIEDIIILNELDHDYTFIPCPIYMQNLCYIVMEMLTDSIQQKHIHYTIEGDDFVVMGEQRLLLSLLFHLCENAIKYNYKYGNVQIILHAKQKTLQIKDNGIGIPEIYHERVFERFFCVDKSHSNMINGTGLGLSIVKHIAYLHHAKIELESTLHIGTTITIHFPFTESPI